MDQKQKDSIYYIQKMVQGVYHYRRLGGDKENIHPKQFRGMSTSILRYVKLNHNTNQFPEFMETTQNLTDKYFDNLCMESKRLWLQHSDRALENLRALNLNEEEVVQAYVKAGYNLHHRLGPKVNPTLEYMWSKLPELLPQPKKSYKDAVKSQPKPNHQRPTHAPHRQSTPIQTRPTRQPRQREQRTTPYHKHREARSTQPKTTHTNRRPHQQHQQVHPEPQRREDNRTARPRPQTVQQQQPPRVDNPWNEPVPMQPQPQRIVREYKEFSRYIKTVNAIKPKFENLSNPDHEPINVQGQKDILSNFHPSKLTFLNKQFSSSEQLYQFLKAVHCEENEKAEVILNQKDPTILKKMGNELNRTHPTKIKAWDSIKGNIMSDIINLKIQNDKIFKNKLVQTYPKPLTHNVIDIFWGSIGFHKNKPIKGNNYFSKILMAARKKLIQESDNLIDEAIRANQEVRNHTPPPNNTTTNQPEADTSGDISETEFVHQHNPPRSTSRASTTANTSDEELMNAVNDEATRADQETRSQTPPPNNTTTEQPEADTSGDISDAEFTRRHNPPRAASRASTPANSSDDELMNAVNETETNGPTQSPIIGPQAYSYLCNKSEWELPRLREDIAILGDSNIRHIIRAPPDQPSIETRSYAGAKPCHFTNMFMLDNKQHSSKYTILSVGINSRGNGVQYNKEQLRKLILAYKQWAPDVKKAITTVQYSSKLPLHQKKVLDQFNLDLQELTAKTKIQLLNKNIPTNQFLVQKDKIHWTTNTAIAMAENWVKNINFGASCHKGLPP